MADKYQPKPEHKFTFGLWTVGNVGRDPFGEPTRERLSPVEIVHLLAEAGAYGVNFHDNDLVPINASVPQRNKIVKEFKAALKSTGLVVPMATINMFTDPAFKDGGFTSNDPAVRAYALQKTIRAIELGVECGASIFVFWGGREGTESDATKNPVDALKRMREAINFVCEYVRDQKYDLKFAMEAKPNEPRGDIFFPTTGAMLGFISTLQYPDMVGVNPEVAHEQMSGLNFMHAVAQAWDAGKLFHIDLNDQKYARYDQDYRFGAETLKPTFYLVKFLEDVGYGGPRHFDAHAYRTEDAEGVKDFARGCMKTYLIFKDKAEQFNKDKEIQALLAEINSGGEKWRWLAGGYSKDKVKRLLSEPIDREKLGARGLKYERLDQLTTELLLGVR